MEFILNLLAVLLLAVWVIGSVILVIAFILNIIHDRKQEKREEARAQRDQEYHEKRMADLR